jgi:hypothetical protein
VAGPASAADCIVTHVNSNGSVNDDAEVPREHTCASTMEYAQYTESARSQAPAEASQSSSSAVNGCRVDSADNSPCRAAILACTLPRGSCVLPGA